MPSAARAKEIAAEGEAHTAAQASALGEAKLAALGAELDAAIAENERPIADAVLTAVPIPAYSEVRQVPVLSLRGGGGAPLASVPGSGVGVSAHDAAAVRAALEP